MSLSANRTTEKRIADELTKRENSQHKTEKKTGEIKKERVLQQSDYKEQKSHSEIRFHKFLWRSEKLLENVVHI